MGRRNVYFFPKLLRRFCANNPEMYASPLKMCSEMNKRKIPMIVNTNVGQ